MCAERSSSAAPPIPPSTRLRSASVGGARSPVCFASCRLLPAARLSLNWDCMCGNEATWHVILWSSQRTLLTANTHISTSQPSPRSASAREPLQGMPAGQTPVLISIESCNWLIEFRVGIFENILKCIYSLVLGGNFYQFILKDYVSMNNYGHISILWSYIYINICKSIFFISFCLGCVRWIYLGLSIRIV